MKNTLFLDQEFNPVLLKNEEADAQDMRNAIFLHFTTTDATNQELQISLRGAVFTVELDPETEYNYQLLGLYWATGATTSIRLTNDDYTSDYVYITFDEIISTDAALQEVEDTPRSYYLQGKEEEALNFMSETASYRNGREYNITTLQRFVQFVFACKAQQATGLLTLTLTLICSGIDTEAQAVFHIRTNLIMDEVFTPTQTVKNGAYIISICYPVENIAQSDRNSIDVYLEMSDGSAQILQGAAIATLTGSGILGSSKFTGLIECQDITQRFIIPEEITCESAEEEIQIATQIPTCATLEDEIPATLTIPQIALVDILNDAVRIVGYGGAEPRTLEDAETIRTTETGDTRMTEEEVT